MLAGCAVDRPVVVQRGQVPGAATGGGSSGDASSGACEGPFGPVAMRVHPLTHIDAPAAGERGETSLVLHVEVRDAYGDLVKGLGKLDVELTRSVAGGVLPGGAMGTGFEQAPAVAWSATEMLDPKENSRRFEWDTRTYRLRLLAPAWVGQWLRDETLRAGAPAKLRLRVTLTGVPDASGNRRVLQDVFVVEP
ncbi:hypothetical protein LBMAG48_04460 [Phycisphaerae bacterium]|nr:hypothetical protein LBMAG48_04460 [Phycisphaerae bacterium]